MGQFYVKLGADITQFQSKMQQATKSLEKAGKKMQNIGKNMSMYVTAPLVAIAAKSAQLYDVQIKAEKQLEAALRVTGQAANGKLEDLKRFASELQAITTVGDESSLKMLQLAINMGLSTDQAKIAVREAIALSKAMGMNEQSAIRYTAALASGDATMLNRYIPTLKKIKDPAERAAKAHELLAQMFSVATAEATAGLGPLQQLSNQFGDLLEEIGAIVVKGFTPLLDKLKMLVTAFQNVGTPAKELIVMLAAGFAMTGPILVGIGFLTTYLMPLLLTGFAALISPVTALVGLFGALVALDVWFNENKTAILINLSRAFLELRNSAIQAMQDIVIAAAPLLDLFGFDTNGLLNKLGELKVKIEMSEQPLKTFGEVFDETLDKIKNKVLQTAEAISGTPKSLEGAITKAGNAASNASGANALGKTDFSNGYKTSPFANIRSPQQIQMDSDLEIAENLLYSVNDGFKNINKSTVKSGRSMADFSSGMDDMVRLLESNLTQLFGSGAGGTGGLFGKLFGIIGGIIGGPAGTIVGGAVGGIFDELAGAGGSFDNDVNFKKLRGGNNSTNINVTGRLVGDDIVFLYDDVKEKQKRYF